MTLTPRKMASLLAIGAVVIIGVGYYFYESHYYPSTTDAYVNAHIAYIAPQISGTVATINVVDHQKVNAGDLLFSIDPAPFQASYDQAAAHYAAATTQLAADHAALAVAIANLAQTKAALDYNQKQTRRIVDLVKSGYASTAEGDQAIANLKTAQANFAADQASLAETTDNISTQTNEVAVAKAALQNARLQLGYTKITAPTTGIVSNFSLRPGMVVTPGTSLFAIVDSLQNVWVDANYKETQLTRIRPGQSASVQLDMYPNVEFTGRVDSISAANGNTFSLLPAENATGNWVKVTQRFIVKIVIPASELKTAYPLRVGASAEVEVNTR